MYKYKQEKRWRSINRAAKFDPNYPINPEVLKEQEEATAKLNLIYKEIDNQQILGGNGLHEHICTFEMLSNDKTRQARECKEWLKKHPIDYPTNDDFWSPCDFCAMMNYVAQDDEGKIMYVSRTFPEERINWTKKFKETNNVSL